MLSTTLPGLPLNMAGLAFLTSNEPGRVPGASTHPLSHPPSLRAFKLMNGTRSAVSSFSAEPSLPCRKLQRYLERPRGQQCHPQHRHGGGGPTSAPLCPLHHSNRPPKHLARICSPWAWYLPAHVVRLNLFPFQKFLQFFLPSSGQMCHTAIASEFQVLFS